MIANMIRPMMKVAQAQASAIFEAHCRWFGKTSSAIRLQILVNQIKHQETKALSQQYLDTYVKTELMETLNASWLPPFLIPRMRKLWKHYWKSEEQGCGETQDLAMSWYFNFLHHDFTQGRTWTWARENWDWIKKALGGDMSFDKFVIYR